MIALRSWAGKITITGAITALSHECQVLTTLLDELISRFNLKEKEELKWKGKDHLRDLNALVCGYLLVVDATQDGDEIAMEIARRWIAGSSQPGDVWKIEVDWDRKIVFGELAL
jgi:hypothetical protein